jgi:hypothetical protein
VLWWCFVLLLAKKKSKTPSPPPPPAPPPKNQKKNPGGRINNIQTTQREPKSNSSQQSHIKNQIKSIQINEQRGGIKGAASQSNQANPTVTIKQIKINANAVEFKDNGARGLFNRAGGGRRGGRRGVCSHHGVSKEKKRGPLFFLRVFTEFSSSETCFFSYFFTFFFLLFSSICIGIFLFRGLFSGFFSGGHQKKASGLDATTLLLP